MIQNNRIVLDSNVFISRLLNKDSIPGRAFIKATSSGIILISEEILEELTDVLGRKKFDPYITIEERKDFLRQLSHVVEFVPQLISIKACRDPRDDKFLSLAVNGKADFIITGDNDLLVLDPFRNIRIISCSTYLNQNYLCEQRAVYTP